MKKLPSLALIAALGFLITCSVSTTAQKDKTVSKADVSEKEEIHKSPAFFPVVIAGSISLVQKLYIKKD